MAKNKSQYDSTLNLPKTLFEMRAGLPKKEPVMLKDWDDNDLYNQLMKHNEGKPQFILHDGPPYANGNIHMGTALNKIIKDIIIREKNMEGFQAPYVPGFDTHGLPIELKALSSVGEKKKDISKLELRQICEKFATEHIDIMSDQFKRLGVIGDFEHPYLTLKPEFEARQIEIFGEMAKKGYIYKGLKPVYWCPDCRTALAEAEIEYGEDECDSIFVRFHVSQDPNGVLAKHGIPMEKTYFVIWTTTTWTLPANEAICLNGEYSFVKIGDEFHIMATDLVKSVMDACHITEYEVVGEPVSGAEFELMRYNHVYLPKEGWVILGDHVTLESGSGCVHTAGGHGVDDFNVCQKYPQIPITVPVDDGGYLTEQAGKYAGQRVWASNKTILADLTAAGAVMGQLHIKHQYPHCWRCHNPIIFRATEQWFCSIAKFREDVYKAIDTVTWMPDWGHDRMHGMVRDRNDWCISRQRTWGVPIPAFYCKKCGAYHITHAAVLEERPELRFPADLYMEGGDQFRGWFQSSLLTSVASKGCAPYKSVLCHGWVVDEQGKQMHKSAGNGVEPSEIIKDYGADIIRLWVASSDYTVDVRAGKNIFKQLSEAYRKIRNTARFILGNLDGFDPNTDCVADDQLQDIDRWALAALDDLIVNTNAGYAVYDFNKVYHAVYNFCVVAMSNFYLDVTKDRLYCTNGTGRKAAQTAMYKILVALDKIIAPILCFTSQEIWDFLPKTEAMNKYVVFEDMPKAGQYAADDAFKAKWAQLIAVRDEVKKVLEQARADKQRVKAAQPAPSRVWALLLHTPPATSASAAGSTPQTSAPTLLIPPCAHAVPLLWRAKPFCISGGAPGAKGGAAFFKKSGETMAYVILNLVCVAALVGIDQAIKLWATQYLAPVEAITVIPHVVELRFVLNQGMAFSLLSGKQLFLILATSAALLLVAYLLFFRSRGKLLQQIAFILVLAGGIGNLIDRVLNGEVVDYINPLFIDFAVFNFADILVCVGVALWVLVILLEEVEDKPSKEQ